jgi:hypothetical protein
MRMKASEWKTFLATWTREVAARKTRNPNEPRIVHPVNGLGFPGATDEEIQATEARLGITLPPSYSEFLKATNGLQQPYTYVAACGGDFWAAVDVDWFAVRNAEWIDSYEGIADAAGRTGGERFVNELRGTLEVSHGGDAAVYLLNPRVTGADGEWEAWFFATWSPEVERFRSFEQMMRTRYWQFGEGVSGGF